MQVHSVVWFFRRLGDGWQETRPLADLQGSRLLDPQQVLQGSSLQSRFSIRLFSLLIFRARPEDTGLYICGSSHGGDFFYAYDLDVQEAQMLSVAPRWSSSRFSCHKSESEALSVIVREQTTKFEVLLLLAVLRM